MKKILILTGFLWTIMSCTHSGNKGKVEKTVDESQSLQKITNTDFKNFAGTFTIRDFPWDVSETPLFADGEVPANFHKISGEDVIKFLNPDVTDTTGYYTGYAITEDEYIAIIYFYGYTKMFGGDNYHTEVYLLTFSFDGKLINQITLGEVSTSVNSNAQRESQELEGSIYNDRASSIKTNYFLEDKPNGSGRSLDFLIKPDGDIEIQNVSGL